MNDDELIALLRKRLHDVESAVHEWLDSADETGAARRDAHRAMMLDLNTLPDKGVSLVPKSVQTFIAVYTETLASREASLNKLGECLKVDFKTAVLTGHDWTDEQRAQWLAAVKEEEAKA